MSETEREIRERPRAAGEPAGDGEGEGLEASRRRAERLLQAADDAIARALSRDSERFLQQTRQAGGE